MWNSIEVAQGAAVYHGRYRLEGDVLVLEWSGGRHQERCGFLKPDFLATHCLKKLVNESRSLAA